MGARAAARQQLGRRIWRGRGRDPAIVLHRRRPETVHLRVSATQMSRSSTRPRGSSRHCVPTACRPQAITVSFRSAPEILTFVNEVFHGDCCERPGHDVGEEDAFRYGDHDRFPIDVSADPRVPPGPTQGSAPTTTHSAPTGPLAGPVHRRRHRAGRGRPASPTRLSGSCRPRPCANRATGVRRGARPADIAILFRSRDSHRDFEAAPRSQGRADLRCTKAWAFSTPTRFRTPSRCSALPGRSSVDPSCRDAPALARRAALGRCGRAARGRRAPRRFSALILHTRSRRSATRIAASFERLRGAVPRWLSWVRPPRALRTA